MIICVTNRLLCRGDFLTRLEGIAAARPWGILLREKDLAAAEYATLALACSAVCQRYQTRLLVHSHPALAAQLPSRWLHLPFPLLEREKRGGLRASVSVHSAEEAVRAEAGGAHCLVAGHIFSTTCKPGLPPRGIEFLRAVCQSVSIPVFAIGGMSADRVPEVIGAGAAGICVMSELMTCPDPANRIREYKRRIGETREEYQ